MKNSPNIIWKVPGGGRSSGPGEWSLSYGEVAEDPAKEMGSGLEEFQCSHQITPQKIQKQPSVHVAGFYLSVSGDPADVFFEWRSTALVNLALFLLV